MLESCASLQWPKIKTGLVPQRKWGSERKEGSLVDVAYAGGWANTRTLQKIYQQVDDATLYEVVRQPKRLREAR